MAKKRKVEPLTDEDLPYISDRQVHSGRETTRAELRKVVAKLNEVCHLLNDE